jgi:hypothetical protein
MQTPTPMWSRLDLSPLTIHELTHRLYEAGKDRADMAWENAPMDQRSAKSREASRLMLAIADRAYE